jgi:uncharacterized protein with PQ loop repeat
MKVTKTIDRVALVVGIAQPLMTLPQIYLVYSTGSATGVSPFMWAGYNIGSIVFLTYAIRHRLWPLIWTQIFWLIVQTPMMLAIFFLPS